MSDVQTHGASGWWKWFTGRKAAEMPVQASARELGRSRRAASVPLREREIDYALAGVVLALLLWGLVMVYSASIGLPESRTFANYSRTYFLMRHVMALGIGFVVSLLAFQVSMKAWEKMAPWLFLASLALLAAVLLPVIGKEVNGARRWIPLGIMNFQPSELVKLTVAIYAASYMTRKMEVREKFLRAVAPMVGAVAVVGILLLAEPDMGAFLVMAAIAMGVLFIGGVNMRAIFLVGAVAVLAFVLMVTLTEWRNERLEAFLDPWSEQHSKGKAYQMIQSLIAISRGGLTGQGLGASVEKLLWLPEAHTDFIVAVIGEELGLAGLLALFFLYLWMVRRMMHIGRQAISLDRVFAGLTAQGIGLWFGVQGFINMGVGLGLLPTKGLTLPFISYGGSAIMMGMVGVAIVLRVDYENRESMQKGRRK